MNTSILRFFAVALLCFPLAKPSHATHTHGQDAFYEHLGNNFYKVTFRLYQDFRSGDANAIREDNPMFVSTFRNGTKIAETSIPSNRLVSVDRPGPTGCVSGGAPIDVRYEEFSANMSLPPVPGGYRLKVERCCMGANIVNLLQSNLSGLELRIDIPGSDTGLSNTQNSSPAFVPVSNIRGCVNTRFQIDFGAIDKDGDSLVYRLGQPNKGGNSNDAKPIPNNFDAERILFAPGFSASKPFGANGYFFVQPGTGKAEVFSSDQGLFMATVACDEYRNGKLLSTVQRSIVVQITNCVYQIRASILKDSAALVSGVPDLGKVQCGGNSRVKFTNTSFGAVGYRWEFGDPRTDSDTSNQFEPEYNYPGPGRYPVKLVANGLSCKDSIMFWVWISNDSLSQEFSVRGGPCAGNEFFLEDRSVLSQGATARYAWQTGSGMYTGATTTVRFPSGGSQNVRAIVITDNDCISYMSKLVEVGRMDVRIESDTVVKARTKLRLRATGAETYAWEPNSFVISALDQPELELQMRDRQWNIPVVVTGMTTGGCKASDTAIISVAERGYFFIPTAFTPNGDGLNDILKPEIVDYQLESFSVFNRRGQRIFHTQSTGDAWDGTFQGTPQGIDTYYWMLRLRSGSGAGHTESGDVTLVR